MGLSLFYLGDFRRGGGELNGEWSRQPKTRETLDFFPQYVSTRSVLQDPPPYQLEKIGEGSAKRYTVVSDELNLSKFEKSVKL